MIHTTFCTFFFFFFNDTATTEIYTLSLHDALPIYLEFTERVSAITGPDGEYTLEYLTKGSHVVGIFDCDCASQTIDLQANKTDVDFRVPTVGEFIVRPVRSTVRVGDKLSYTLAYTITEGR